MAISCVRCGTIALILLSIASSSFAVPVPAANSATIKDRANYIPRRKHVPLPGKIVAILLPDAQPVLSLEGRSGPANQLCIGYNGSSYRWVYVQVKERPMIGSLNLPVGDKGEKKRFDSLSLATPETVKQFGIKGRYALVEVEVNGGLGSPADDSFVATKMRQLDDTKEFPFKLDDVIANVRQQYEQRVKDQVREIDSGMAKAASGAIKDHKATGPRERAAVMFVTWLPEAKRLRVHFRTTISDGEYQYAGGVNIDLGGARTMKAGADRRRDPESWFQCAAVRLTVRNAVRHRFWNGLRSRTERQDRKNADAPHRELPARHQGAADFQSRRGRDASVSRGFDSQNSAVMNRQS